MRRCVWGVLAALLLAGCGARQSRDAVPTELTRKEAAAAAPVRLLSVRVNYLLDEKGGYVRTTEQKYRVLNLQGVEGWSSTGAGWSPWYLERPSVKARVVAPDGSAQALDPATLSESPANPEMPELYSDARVLRAPLPSVAVGSVVEETIVERTKRPFFDGGSVHYLLLQSDIPRDQVELRIDAPATLPLRYEVRGTTLTPEESRANGRRVVLFRGGPFPAMEAAPPLLPNDVPRWPHIAFGTGPGWKELARAYGKRVASAVEGTKVPDDALKLLKGGRSDREKVERLLDWMNDRVRYVSLAFGESAIIPAAPGDTLKRGYGDCKDKATLLVALLRAAGIRAHLALLRSGAGEDVLPSLPALNAFNHAIVVIPGKAPLWIDPTSPYARAGELPVADRGRYALIIDHSTSELVRTPGGDPAIDTYAETREVHLPEYGQGRVVETTRAGGALEQQLRGNLAGPEDQLRKALGDYVKKTYDAQELGELVVAKATQVSTPFEVRLEAKRAGAAHMFLLGGSVRVDAKVVFSWLPEGVFGDKPRDVDLVLPMPYSASVRYLVHPPKDFVAKQLPKLPAISLGPVELTRSVRTLPAGDIEAIVAVRTTKDRWTPADLADFRAGVRRYESENMPVLEVEHRGQRLIDDNKLVAGLRVFLDGVKAKPNSAVAQMRLALNLVDAGFGTAARAAARRAAAAAPNDPDMHSFLGTVLLRDALGRVGQRGFDRAGAIAAYRRAAELRPDDPEPRLHLANVLEENEDGRRYGPGASLAEAIAEYDAIGADKLAQYDGGSYSANPAFALMYAGRHQEARERLAALPPERQPPVILVVTAAVLSGPAAALTEADRLGARGEERSEILAAASGVLAELRRYPEAAALVSAASSGSAKAADYESRARHLRIIKQIDPDKLPSKTPDQVVRKLFAITALDRELPDALVARAARGTGSSVRRAERELRTVQSVLPGPIMADTVVSIAKLNVSGDAKLGYRVEASVEGAGPTNRGRIYLIQEDGVLRVRAMDDLGELGEQALADLNAGNVKRARAWLEWARSETGKGVGGDPLGTAPWLGVYREGKGDLKLAAAALCGPRCAKEGRRLLDEARKKAKPDEVVALDHALAGPYFGDGKRLLELSRALLAAHPRSAAALRYESRALGLLGRYDEQAKRAEQGLATAREEDRPIFQLRLAEARARSGDLKGAAKVYRALVASGRADAGAYDSLVWLSLFEGGANEESLTHALRAAEMTRFDDSGALYTLAVVYAELGKLKESRDTLNRLLSKRSDRQPTATDHYIIGRLAEHLGLTDEARRAYRAVTKPGEDIRTSTYTLAQQRLNKL